MSGAVAVRDEVQQRVREVVALADGNRKSAIAFAARVLNLPFDRVRRMYYGQARMIHAHEADQIRAYVTAAQELIEARAAYEAQRASFLKSHPALARFAPRPLPRTPALEEAEQAVAADERRRS